MDAVAGGPARPPATTEAPPPAAPEPATGRALWPTFMRRTLAEDALRPPRKPDA